MRHLIQLPQHNLAQPADGEQHQRRASQHEMRQQREVGQAVRDAQIGGAAVAPGERDQLTPEGEEGHGSEDLQVAPHSVSPIFATILACGRRARLLREMHRGCLVVF